MKSQIPGITLDAEPIVSSRNIVYRARDAEGRSLIVKVLGKEYPKVPEIARFRTEFDIVAKLSGPFVEKAVGLYPWEHTLAMVLENSGPDLRSVLDGQPLTVAEFLDLAVALVEALRFVHAARVIHKDINPSNICWNRSSGELRLIDFGIATEFETADQACDSTLEGSLPYLAPEQSGRMNRKVDYRSDYYSLGITLYEVLTGKLPFQANDTLEWIHQHLTRDAIPVMEIRPDVPQAVSDIISKLMRKNADERYQSAFGLLHDLRACRDAWQNGAGRLTSFQVGRRDVSERFAFPQKLFGRDSELSALTVDYAGITRGSQRQCFILGQEGVGKSALVKDLFRLKLEQHTYFIEGSFEQNSKDVPFFAFRAALQTLAKALLLEHEDELQRLRKQLTMAFEGRAGSLLSIAPQLEWIIGPQNPSENADGEVARNRCIYLLIHFLKTVARKGRPIVLFLDNLQWADNPSLQLIRQLSSQLDVQFLLTIASVRDHGLSSEDSVIRLVHELKDLPHVQALRLEALPLTAVIEFLAQTLLSSEERVASLASLLMEKTNGNPYFLKSLLKHLYEDGDIVFDQEQGAWSWDVEAIARMGISDNVIDVILKRMARLSPQAQQTLKMSACIGTKFNEDLLFAIKSSLSPDQIHQSLLEGVREGFIVLERSETAEKPDYRFQHDRIQEALYAQLPESERVDHHLMIGRYLSRAVTESDVDDTVIDTIRHLNLATRRMHGADEKLQLARLNHRAGVKALKATAYESASAYLLMARDLIEEQGWKNSYELVYQVHFKLSEALYNAGRLDESQVVFQAVKAQAHAGLDQAQLNLMRAYQLNLLGRLEEALNECLTAMHIMGVSLKRNPNPLGIVWYYIKIKRYLTPEFFTNYEARLKPVDESICLQMKILSALVLISYQLKLDNLLATSVVMATYYSCHHGFTKESAGVFVNHSVLLVNIFRDFVVPPKLCALADTLDQHFNCVDERPFLKFVAACFTYNLYSSYDECLRISQEGEKWALQIGDLAYQIYNRNASLTVRNYIYHLEPDTVSLESHLHHPRDADRYWIYYLWSMPALSLVGLTEEPTRFDSNYMTEATLYEKNSGNPLSVVSFHLFKSMLAVIFDDKELGYEHGMKALPVLKALLGLTEQLMIPYHFLSFSQSYQGLDAGRRRLALRIMRRMHGRVAGLAKKLPKNLQMVQWLMEAELARLQGKNELAATRFDQAIQAAQQASYTAMVALFNDIAARFYLEAGKPRIAGLYFKEAYFHYDVWGAKEKLRDLKEKYEDLLGERVIKRDAPRTRGPRTTLQTTMMGTRNDNAGSELDLMAVVAASEILASEVVLESLLIKLMRTAIQSTGAQNGTLILKEDARFHVCAEIRDGKESGLLDIPFESSEHIPRSLIQFALRSNEPVVIDDASMRNELQSDPYIAQYRPQSLLCVPIVNRAQICGVIYVEHMSVQGAFTLDRVKVLSVIASQAAIFISNARLYASLEEKVAHRTRELATKTKDIQTMLQNMMQGIFTIKADLTIHSEYSAYLETIFDLRDLAGRSALDLLFDQTDVSADKRMQVRTVVDFCLHGGGTALEFSLNSHLLLREIVRKRSDGHDQFLELDWQPIEGDAGQIDKLMVVVRDTTEIRELRHEAEQQRRELHILSRLINTGPQRTESFLSNTYEKIAASRDLLKSEGQLPIAELKLIFRNLHTIKGNARTLGFDEVADAVHHEEEIYAKALTERGLIQKSQELLDGLERCRDSVALYEQVYQRTLKGLQSAPGAQESYQGFYEEVGRLLSQSDSKALRDQLALVYERYRVASQSFTLESILASIRDSLPGLAEELHKVTPELKVTPCPARFLPKVADIIGDVMMHCIRNSLDHGIEYAADRENKGKNARGTITVDCSIESDTGWLMIRVYDDGRGIHLQALEEKGRAMNLLAPESDDHMIASMVFVEGVSTKKGVTAISGRGIGMDAVKASIEGLGGSIEIEFLGPADVDRHRPFCFHMAVPLASCLAGYDQEVSAA